MLAFLADHLRVAGFEHAQLLAVLLLLVRLVRQRLQQLGALLGLDAVGLGLGHILLRFDLLGAQLLRLALQVGNLALALLGFCRGEKKKKREREREREKKRKKERKETKERKKEKKKKKKKERRK